ncbi:uncharacterized protein Dmoj_GI25589, isoform A [Drosophila mojavensis]|uniref:Uncharacterized protein, isoform A n=1 Tax=Drosophila mojavensis TaxID=7230 RepID=A0A0Q9WX25_DROMO|nr:uncharacterized protein Dmoj_GI25589, isoform A [Drosophila mojavensis]
MTNTLLTTDFALHNYQALISRLAYQRWHRSTELNNKSNMNNINSNNHSSNNYKGNSQHF